MRWALVWYILAGLCALYVVVTVLVWVVCLWAYVVDGPFMSSDQAFGLLFGGFLAACVVAGLGFGFGLAADIADEAREERKK